MDTETQSPELNLEGGGTLPVENVSAPAETVALPIEDVKGDKDTSHAFFCQDTSHAFFWTGTDIMDVLYQGSANSSTECYEQSSQSGAATCNIVPNPAYVAPVPEVVLTPEAVAYNQAYSQGYQDGYAKYEDVRQMVQHFAQNEAVAGNDVEKFDFVVYVRSNP